MITRIVKLTFAPSEVTNFLSLYDEVHHSIKNMPGCISLELKRDAKFSNILFTISLWKSEEALNEYRQSTLFKQTWAKTKTMFCGLPQAWSLEHIK